MLGRADWTAAFLDAVEDGQVRLAELVARPEAGAGRPPRPTIAARAKTLLARGGGLPDPDRQKVIDALAPAPARAATPPRARWFSAAVRQVPPPQRRRRQGRARPVRHGRACRARAVIHILDPSRSVEGNFVQYTVATTDGRVINGLLASETKTAVELLDAEGKPHAVLREDIDEMAASKKSLMPEGFEKQVTPGGADDLLAFLTQRGKYLPLDLRKAATTVSTRGMFYDADCADGAAGLPRLVAQDLRRGAVPARRSPGRPRAQRRPALRARTASSRRGCPGRLISPCNAPAQGDPLPERRQRLGFSRRRKGSVSMIVRLHYADGKVEDHPLENGVQFADYIRVVDVPGSKLAFTLGRPADPLLRRSAQEEGRIDRIELVKGPDATAPVVMAVTVEGGWR